MERKIEDYLDLPYHFVIAKDEDGGFDVAVAELAGCVTYSQAWEDIPLVIREAMTSWIGSALKHGDAVPEPSPIAS
jgi:antitoxin HicB